MTGALLIRNAEINGFGRRDLLISAGRIAAIGSGLRAGNVEEIDAEGGALLPGLHDHHIHLLALAAEAESLSLGPAASLSTAQFTALLVDAATRSGPEGWVRVTNYDESFAGLLDRWRIDAIIPDRPVRIQHRTGALWVLNSRGLLEILAAGSDAIPDCVERNAAGELTGRIWRGDIWLRERLPIRPPNLRDVGAALCRSGITAVTDTSASTTQVQANLLATAVRSGALPQRLTLMSAGPLDATEDSAYRVGAVKFLLDDADLPDIEEVCAKVGDARRQGRAVAFHCVTTTQLAFVLAVFGTTGAEPGDRIEHGAVILAETIAELARLGVTIVTQPGFVHGRGNRYLREMEPQELSSAWRCGSLLRAGVPVLAGSDAPYGSPDPWRGMASAVTRRTASGAEFGADERITPARALRLYSGGKKLAVGQRADLCLLPLPIRLALSRLPENLVAATIIGGRIVYRVED